MRNCLKTQTFLLRGTTGLTFCQCHQNRLYGIFSTHNLPMRHHLRGTLFIDALLTDELSAL